MPLLFSLLLIVGALGRFIPHPANFAPIGALGIFAGLYARNWKQGIALPLIARLITDVLIGFFNPGVMVAVYISTLCGTFLGMWARKNKNIFTIGRATIAGAVIFFVVTNFAVWLFDGLYPMNVRGLIESYTLALPFFRNSLFGDIFYAIVIIGGYELALRANYKLQISNNKKLIHSKA